MRVSRKSLSIETPLNEKVPPRKSPGCIPTA